MTGMKCDPLGVCAKSSFLQIQSILNSLQATRDQDQERSKIIPKPSQNNPKKSCYFISKKIV